MKFINRLVVILSLSLILNCSGNEEEKIVLDSRDLESQMIESYEKGLKALKEGDVLFAAKNFNNVENLYPQSIWAPRSLLMAAYSYYSQDYYGDAISELNRFIKTYPNSKDISYAYYLLATSYYELIIDEKKDLSPLNKSKKNYNFIIENYPNSDFALDARFKIVLIDNILALKELYIARYYQNKQKWIPALNRLNYIINEYDETQYVEEAIHRLVEINHKIGLISEAEKYAALLGYNYQSSEWYKKSYSIFNKDYEDPIKKIKKDKQNIIIKKFKSLFE